MSRSLNFLRAQLPCLIGLETCASSHCRAREIAALGREVRLMLPAYLKPKVKRQRNDVASAKATCEAVSRPDMRLVPARTPSSGACRCCIASTIRSCASVPDASVFRSGRQFAAYLGLVPRQNSSGGKHRVGRVSKMGNSYLRRLLVVGATSLIRRAGGNTTRTAAGSGRS